MSAGALADRFGRRRQLIIGRTIFTVASLLSGLAPTAIVLDLARAIQGVGFASAAQVMMTYLPLYLQNVFGFSPAVAGVKMLPFALPLFFFPRIAAHIATKISGRALLTIGLFVVAAGNLTTAIVIISHLPLVVIWFGMFLTSCGAGVLNGSHV